LRDWRERSSQVKSERASERKKEVLRPSGWVGRLKGEEGVCRDLPSGKDTGDTTITTTTAAAHHHHHHNNNNSSNNNNTATPPAR
jgi:hypothetical protein